MAVVPGVAVASSLPPHLRAGDNSSSHQQTSRKAGRWWGGSAEHGKDRPLKTSFFLKNIIIIIILYTVYSK